MQEFVGNVKLNLDYYSGEDLYSDGDIENEILDIVKTTSQKNIIQLLTQEQIGLYYIIYLL